MKQRTSLNDALAALVLVIYFAELVFPMVTTLLPSAIVRLVCFVLWLFFVTTTDTKFLLRKGNFALLTIYVFMILYPAICGHSVISHRYMSMSLVFCGSIIFQYYYAKNKFFLLKKILIITVILSLITMLTTYGQLLLDPYISRSIKSSGEYSAGLARRGIGGYTFVYYITALSIPALYWGIKEKRKKMRFGALIWYAFSVLFIIKSNYMTALLTVVICSSMLVLVLSFSSQKWGLGLGLVLAGTFAVLISNMQGIINLIAQYLPARVSRVLVTAGEKSVAASIAQEFLKDRWPVILSSVNTFLGHPIFGLLGSGTLGFDGEFLTGFGQHSFVFDTFALYGLLGGLLGTFAALRPLKRNNVWANHAALWMAMATCVVMLYVLNNATESIALVTSIISPAVCVLYCNQDIE